MHCGFDLSLRELLFDTQSKPFGEFHSDFLDPALAAMLEDHRVERASGLPRKLKRERRLSTTRFTPQ